MDEEKLFRDFVGSLSGDKRVSRLLEISVLRVFLNNPQTYDFDVVREEVQFVVN